MINTQTKHDGYELQGVAMGIKSLIISLVEYPEQLQSKSDVIGQVKTDLAKLNELAKSILADVIEPAAETETAAPVADDPAEYLDADEFAAAVGLTDGEMMRAEREDAERRAAAAVRCPIGACSTVPCMHSGDGEPWDLDR